MFCPHCGTKLPDNAKFCVSCGKVVAAPYPAKYPHPPQDQKTAPYTLPVGKGSSYDHVPPVNSQNGTAGGAQGNVKPPSYTVPLDPDDDGLDKGGAVSGYYDPYANQSPAYTEPIKKSPGHKEPTYYDPGRTAPVEKTLDGGEHRAASDEPAETILSPAPIRSQSAKRIRKLPILLGAVALVLAIVLAAGFAGGKDTTARARMKNGEFTFTPEALENWFAEDLKENSIPLTWKGNTTYYTLKNGAEKVGIFWLYTKPNGSVVTTVRLELPNSQKYTQWFDTAVKCLVKQCHGAMTEEMLSTLLSCGVITWDHDETTGENFQRKICTGYGMELTLLEMKEDLVAIIRTTGADPFEAPEMPDAANTPAQTIEPAYRIAPRYVKWHFKFDETQFLELYREQLEANGIIQLEFGELTGKYPRVGYLQYNGENVIKISLYHGVKNSREKTDEEKLRRVEASYCGEGTYTEEEMELFVKAIALTIHTCHGDMTEALWAETMANPTVDNLELQRGRVLMSVYEVDSMEIKVYAGSTTMDIECNAEG